MERADIGDVWDVDGNRGRVTRCDLYSEVVAHGVDYLSPTFF